MDLDLIEVDREVAKSKLDEYRKSLATDRNAEDEAIAAAYRMAAQGYPIISLSTAIAAGGWFDNGLPRLAVARADAKTCEDLWAVLAVWDLTDIERYVLGQRLHSS